MNQATPGISSDASASAPQKRKRGRPRKYPVLEDQSAKLGDTARTLRDQNLTSVENVHTPPVFKGLNGNQGAQAAPTENIKDVMIGQFVSGVIEAVFDGGYLLSVRVGNSETALRGVVFKPGHYVPVSAENDIAPDVKMIKRNEIPLPASQGKLVPSMPAQTVHPATSRGGMAPVVLQPAASANGMFPPNQPASVAPHMPAVAFQSINPLNGSNSSKDAATQGYDKNGSGMQDPGESSREAAAKSVRMPGAPFENLVTEVIKRIETPSQAEGHDGNSKSADESGSSPMDDDEDSDSDQPLFVEPLRSVQPPPNINSNFVPKSVESDTSGKMTGMLQENTTQSSAAPAAQ